MAVFKFVVSNKKTSYQVEKDQNECVAVIGKTIGDKINGEILGLNGYELHITGGSDVDGFPMKHDIIGIGRKRLNIKKGTGMKQKHPGLRRRKSLRGNTISEKIAQINCKVTKEGSQKLDEILGKKETTKDEEKE